MKRFAAVSIFTTLMIFLTADCLSASWAVPAAEGSATKDDGWISLFDGKSLEGWKDNKETPNSVVVEDGCIVTQNGRSHLFYDGPVKNHDFNNFEFKADVKTTPGSNSGIYFHTKYQAKEWPSQGYEAQVNNSSPVEPKVTGSLYGVSDVLKAPAKDHEWFNYHIIVNGKRIIIKINGKTLVDFVEPARSKRSGRVLSSGTFAIQAHDPKSKVYYKNIKVKPLPDNE